MKRKEDVRNRLVESFKDLVRKGTVEKITVQEITTGAGVIRPTFYHHFQDKYQLLEDIFREEVMDPVRDLIHNNMLSEAVTLMFVQMGKEKEYYSNVSRVEGQNSFESVVKTCIYETILELINDKGSGRESRHRVLSHEMLATYYSEFLGFIVLYWIQDGMTATPKEMSDLFNYIKDHSLYDIINEME